jgi:hypothetical protein
MLSRLCMPVPYHLPANVSLAHVLLAGYLSCKFAVIAREYRT